MRDFTFGLLRTSALAVLMISPALSADPPESVDTPASKTQRVLDQSEAEGKYTFLLFYRDDSAAVRTMAQIVKDGVAKREAEATLTYVQITNPAEKAIVARFGVSRAPMPLTLAVAPNGAITGILQQKATAQNIEDAFVTPTMMRAMKSLQEGKLVLVCVMGSSQSAVPTAVKDFKSDPHFKDRLVTVSFQAADPAETKLLNQMQLDPKATATKAALLAPPGVLVGKFDSTATKDDIAAALAKAGKCCEDPNCKHNQQNSASPTKQGARGRK